MPDKPTTKLYYDVTQLVHWDGRLTGIPRVMNEQAIRFRAKRPDVVFVSWVKEIEQFCEIDLDRTLSELGKGIHYLKAGQDTPNGKPAEITEDPVVYKRSQVEALRHGAVRVVKAVLRRSARLAPEMSHKVEERLKHERMAQYKAAEFGRGDRVFIPWGEWWDDNFIAQLKNWHHNHGLGIIQIVHDMGPIMIPQFSGSGGAGGSTETFPKYCREILPICDLVLCVSQNTKKEAAWWLKQQGLKVPKLEVFRLGDDFKVAKAVQPTDDAFTQSGLKKGKYILCVGTIEARKNHALLYYVYKQAIARGIDLPQLAIVGRRGWGTDDIYSIISNDPEMKGKITFLHNMSDQELSWMYNNCLFTIFPSLYEGWGIPIAESIARGVPCLCSNTTSMVEIAEGFVDHFTPTSTDECLAAIVKMLDPAKLERAREHTKDYKQRSWDDSFEQVNNYLEEL